LVDHGCEVREQADIVGIVSHPPSDDHDQSPAATRLKPSRRVSEMAVSVLLLLIALIATAWAWFWDGFCVGSECSGASGPSWWVWALLVATLIGGCLIFVRSTMQAGRRILGIVVALGLIAPFLG
jgi:hypothetical protein